MPFALAGLGVGAAAHAVVSFALCAYMPMHSSRPDPWPRTEYPSWARGYCPLDWPSPDRAFTLTRPGLTYTQVQWGNSSAPVHMQHLQEVGIPFRAFAGATTSDFPPAMPRGSHVERGLWRVPDWLRPGWTYLQGYTYSSVVPVEPRWGMLLVNTAVWGAAAAGVWSLLLVARDRRRRGKGLCVACGYAISDLVRCPECGTPRA